MPLAVIAAPAADRRICRIVVAMPALLIRLVEVVQYRRRHDVGEFLDVSTQFHDLPDEAR